MTKTATTTAQSRRHRAIQRTNKRLDVTLMFLVLVTATFDDMPVLAALRGSSSRSPRGLVGESVIDDGSTTSHESSSEARLSHEAGERQTFPAMSVQDLVPGIELPRDSFKVSVVHEIEEFQVIPKSPGNYNGGNRNTISDNTSGSQSDTQKSQSTTTGQQQDNQQPHVGAEVKAGAAASSIKDLHRKLYPKAEEIKGKRKNFRHCQGDCDKDSDCNDGLVCFQRNKGDPVPGCDASIAIISGRSDYCILPKDRDNFQDVQSSGRLKVKFVRNDPNEHKRKEKNKLGECEGDCDSDNDCRDNLVCQKRGKKQGFDGCTGGERDDSETDYCVRPHLHTKFGNLFKEDKRNREDDSSTTKSITNNQGSEHNGRPWVVSTSSAYGKEGKFALDKPRNLREGDMLVMFLSRSDDPLPLKIRGWNTEASCFKQDNGQQRCFTTDMCKKRADYDHEFCAYFNDKKHNGQDLATVVYTRWVTKKDVNEKDEDFVKIKLPGTHKNMHPGWAILAAIRNAAGVRGWSGVSCDASDHAVFDSVPGAEKDDLLLLDFSFDDATTPEKFMSPSNTNTVAYIVGSDETGMLYAQEGIESGPTGKRETRGKGGPDCKDVNLSLVIKKK